MKTNGPERQKTYTENPSAEEILGMPKVKQFETVRDCKDPKILKYLASMSISRHESTPNIDKALLLNGLTAPAAALYIGMNRIKEFPQVVKATFRNMDFSRVPTAFQEDIYRKFKNEVMPVRKTFTTFNEMVGQTRILKTVNSVASAFFENIKPPKKFTSLLIKGAREITKPSNIDKMFKSTLSQVKKSFSDFYQGHKTAYNKAEVEAKRQFDMAKRGGKATISGLAKANSLFITGLKKIPGFTSTLARKHNDGAWRVLQFHGRVLKKTNSNLTKLWDKVTGRVSVID